MFGFLTSSLHILITIIILVVVLLWLRNNVPSATSSTTSAVPTMVAPSSPPSIQPFTTPTRQLSRRSGAETLTAEVFTELCHYYGLDVNRIQYGVRPHFLRNPATGRCLELDMYYDDGTYRFALEYQGQQHYVFPNFYHPDTDAGYRAFTQQCQRDACKLEGAEAEGIYLIRVPYTVDTCDLDATSVSGHRHNPRLTRAEKRRRLYAFIDRHLTHYLSHFQ